MNPPADEPAVIGRIAAGRRDPRESALPLGVSFSRR
jgi:hypothetical protein